MLTLLELATINPRRGFRVYVTPGIMYGSVCLGCALLRPDKFTNTLARQVWVNSFQYCDVCHKYIHPGAPDDDTP